MELQRLLQQRLRLICWSAQQPCWVHPDGAAAFACSRANAADRDAGGYQNLSDVYVEDNLKPFLQRTASDSDSGMLQVILHR